MKNNNRRNWFILFAVLSVISLLINAAFVLFVYLDGGSGDISKAEKIEASFISTGLSIIGLALSVWGGINIINALDKKEIDKIKKDFDGFKEVIKSMKSTVKKTKRSIQKNTAFEKEFNYQRFLQQLLISKNDAIAQYFYNEFTKVEADITDYGRLLIIEQLMGQVFSLHNSASKKNSELVEKAKIALEKIDEVSKEQKAPEGTIIHQYLQLRYADFKFYQGYYGTEIDNATCFLTAANTYIETAKYFDIDISNDYDIDKIDSFRPKDDKLIVAAYFMNTIGEAYSKIIQYASKVSDKIVDNIVMSRNYLELTAKKALFFCECSVRWNIECGEIKEIHYRNLGCAYERVDNFRNQFAEHKSEILNNYKKSFGLMSADLNTTPYRRNNVYHTNTMYLEKYISYSITGVSGIHWAFNSKESVQEFISQLKNKRNDNEALLDCFEHYQTVTSIACRDFPQIPRYYIMHGFTYCWVIILILSGHVSLKNKYSLSVSDYLKIVENDCICLELMNIEENADNTIKFLYKELKNRIQIIEKYFLS